MTSGKLVALVALSFAASAAGCRCVKEPPVKVGPEPARVHDAGPPVGAWSIVGKIGPERPAGVSRVRGFASTERRAVIWREAAIDVFEGAKGAPRLGAKPPPCAVGPKPFEVTDDALHLARVRTEYGDDIVFDAGATCGYDLEHDAFVPVPALPISAGTVVTELKNDDLLLTGGSHWIGALGGHSEPDADAVRWVAETKTLVTLPKMALPRMHHAALRLLDGSVMLFSGKGLLVEVFEPSKNAFRGAGAQEAGGVATLTGDGRVLFLEPDGCSLYDPSPGTWTKCAPMPVPRTDFATTTLADGRVLVSGGFGRDDAGTAGPTQPRADLYDPHLDAWENVPAMPLSMARHDSLRLSNGSVILFGGVATGPDYAAVNVLEILMFTPPKDP